MNVDDGRAKDISAPRYAGTKSVQAFIGLCNYLPGGVNSPARAFREVDIDGAPQVMNTYIIIIV